MKRLYIIGLCFLLAACMTPRAEKYLAACVEAGHDEATCEMQAQEIDAQAWQGLGAGMQDAGAAMSYPYPRSRLTNCNTVGPIIRCTTF